MRGASDGAVVPVNAKYRKENALYIRWALETSGMSGYMELELKDDSPAKSSSAALVYELRRFADFIERQGKKKP